MTEKSRDLLGPILNVNLVRQNTTSINSLSKKTIEEDCAICLEKLKTKREVSHGGCYHYMHTECLEEWHKRNQTCPTCRLEKKRDLTGSCIFCILFDAVSFPINEPLVEFSCCRPGPVHKMCFQMFMDSVEPDVRMCFGCSTPLEKVEILSYNQTN